VRAVLDAGAPHLTRVDDPAADPAERALLARLGKVCAAAVPIVCGGEPWGEVYVTRGAAAPPMAAGDVAFLEVVASQVAIAVGRAEAFTDLRAAAYHDPLTGLANRRAFDERLAAALDRDGVEVVLMFADIDRLKAINDADGHEAGDRALRTAGAVLAAAAGDGTLAARIGGDEFGLVLEDRTVAAAAALMADVDARLRHGATPLSMSWGVASTADELRAAPALMRAADAAQYAAKARDRSRRDPAADALAALRPGPPSDEYGKTFDRGLAAALRQL
jgi:diguanylate cyclase (GGDEF)-like protein